MSGSFTITRNLNYDPFLTPLSNQFTKTALNVDKKRRKEVDATYTFTFSCRDEIPNGGTLKLTLPSSYNLIASFPPV